MAPIAGKYNLESSENFEEFMKALGVGLMMRKLGASTKPTAEVVQGPDNQWTIKSISTVKTTEITFTLGKPFQETTTDGRECTSLIVMEGENKMIHTQTDKNGKVVKFIREFTDTHLNMTCEFEGVVSKRIYKRA